MPSFTLRPLQPADSAAVTDLITGFDGGLTTRYLVDTFAAITSGTEFRTLGVVAEAPGVPGLVGMGTLRFSRVQFNGEVLPLVFLDGLRVRPEFRGRGLGYQLAAWRVQQAREAYGDRCVIATGMLHDNHASRAVAKKWCREFIDPAVEVLVLPARRQPPRPLAGITVRELAPEHYEAFAAQQNRYYQRCQLYPPTDPDLIRQAQAVSVEGRRPYRYYAAVDTSGRLLAGAQTWARGLLKADQVNQVPVPIRLLNQLMHLYPADFVIHDVAVSAPWCEPGHLAAAGCLWEAIRWHARDQGNVLAIAFDPRDPARAMVTARPWHQPRPRITLALHGPAPIDREQLVFGFGRV